MSTEKALNRVTIGLAVVLGVVLVAALVYWFVLRSQPPTQIGFPKN